MGRCRRVHRKALGMVYEPRDSGSIGGLRADTDGIFTARSHSWPSSATSRPVVFGGCPRLCQSPGAVLSMGYHWPRGIGGRTPRTPGTPAGRWLRDGAVVARTAVSELASAPVAALRRRRHGRGRFCCGLLVSNNTLGDAKSKERERERAGSHLLFPFSRSMTPRCPPPASGVSALPWCPFLCLALL